jgi:predicted enzyme related to lactoylglutathione lyase
VSLHLVSLTIDANDPLRLARFWAEVLGWNVDDSDPDEIGLVPTDGTRFGIVVEPVPEPKVGQNRVHLDITTTSIEDQNESVAHLLEVGAHHVDIGQTPEEDHVVLADPEGNELCILAPNNNFLAGTKRLGSINSDGLKETGYFWSAALGWPLVWDQDEETAIRSPHGGPKITWGGPPLRPKTGKYRLHLELAPPAGGDQPAEVERLLALGATHIDIGQGPVDWVVLADPDGHEFCVLSPG